MANFTITGKKNPGDLITAAGGASPVVAADTITIHGYREPIGEAIRRGLIRTASVSGNTTVFQLEQNPDKFNQ
ncbi:hypothetical protein UFOVP562_5 [uncultured Caudovirales phage]|jgi:hypothetical protein|uniref:Uncharacterized protein n=1 Tax=uncultured Caudovirales phage TaxID=2100421 RepID=A0A6J5MTP6_9CAUD|nr:hypothetical protein UFOVP562_5 [uncultured Caudovirales phage]